MLSSAAAATPSAVYALTRTRSPINAGSGDGFIFRFAEQAQDFMVKAHPLPDGSTNWPPKGADHSLCRVTAMWFDKNKGLLYSSGDDGWLHAWKPQQWDPRASDHTPNPKPVKSFDLNQWVLSELNGTIVKMDDKELDKANKELEKAQKEHEIQQAQLQDRLSKQQIAAKLLEATRDSLQKKLEEALQQMLPLQHAHAELAVIIPPQRSPAAPCTPRLGITIELQ